MSKSKKTNSKSNKEEMETAIETMEEVSEEIEQKQKLERKIERKKETLRKDLNDQLLSQGKFGKHFYDMVEDYLYLVDLKERLKYDIDTNGIRYKHTGGNGFTAYKPNESCERLLKTNAQMLKILQDLELKTSDDGGDEGDDLL